MSMFSGSTATDDTPHTLGAPPRNHMPADSQRRLTSHACSPSTWLAQCGVLRDGHRVGSATPRDGGARARPAGNATDGSIRRSMWVPPSVFPGNAHHATLVPAALMMAGGPAAEFSRGARAGILVGGCRRRWHTPTHAECSSLSSYGDSPGPHPHRAHTHTGGWLQAQKVVGPR